MVAIIILFSGLVLYKHQYVQRWHFVIAATPVQNFFYMGKMQTEW